MKLTFSINPLLIAAPALLAGLVFSACGDDDNETIDNTAAIEAAQKDVQSNYPNIVYASYLDSLNAAKDLDAAIDAFIADPTAPKLEAAKQAWLDSREPYLQTEVYRFYDGPIDNADDGPEGMINAWPLDESYIDAVAGDAPGSESGIINDPSVTISAEKLEELNEQGGEENIATGYHAIEFLLWGQDFNTDGPGNRPHTDFIEGEDATLPNADRRKLYLETVSDLLVTHLQQLVDAWAPGGDNYRASFESTSAVDATSRIMAGMLILSGFETGGERLQAALTSADQEDEHSCFSDNTHRDMIQDIQGVKNVFEGEYGDTIDGAGIEEVIKAENAELADQIDDQIEESLRLANALPVPFDQAIVIENTEGRAKVADLVNSLQALEGLLEEAFRGLGLEVPSTDDL